MLGFDGSDGVLSAETPSIPKCDLTHDGIHLLSQALSHPGISRKDARTHCRDNDSV